MVSSSKKSSPENAQFIAPLPAPFLIRTDAAGNVLAVCRKFAELLFEHSILIARTMNLVDIFSQLGGAAPFNTEGLLLRGFPPVFESSVRQAGGPNYLIRWMATPVHKENAPSREWQLTGTEVPSGEQLCTDGSELTASLRREKNLSDWIINSLPGVFYLFDHKGQFLRWNKQLEKVSGYNAEEIALMRPTDFFSEEEKPYITSRINTAFDEGVSDAESWLVTRNGDQFPFYFTALLITYESRPCLIGMGIDISEIKKAEEKIKLSNERYMLATRATNDVIWDWDVKQATPLWGEGFATQFGYHSPEKMNARGFWESNIHPDDRQRVVNSREDFIRRKTDDLWFEEYRFRKADGQFAMVSDRGFLVFGEEGQVIRVVGSMQDVTEKKNLQQKLLQQELHKQRIIAKTMIDAQENERAAIGKELHDNVNQILSTAKLYLELYRGRPEEANLLVLCLENINHAIREIRNISRALVPSTIGDLGLPDSVHELVESIRQARNLHVEFHSRGWSDENISNQQKLMLFRIIQEQVNNVVKHAQAKNLFIELTMDLSQNRMNLRITDDGNGFDPENVKKGMGLSNIMSRADHFGGITAIQSQPGKGCVLQVQIPVQNLSKIS
jgi:PAS domain S-box-containing protein